MDPISVASACLGTIGTISKLSVQITGFVSDVRDARKYMGAVSRELTSLSFCLASLRDDSEKVKFPGTLLDVIHNCDAIAKDIADVLTELSTAKTARVRWTLQGRDHINKLRSSLESHKSCIDVALDMASFQLLSAVKEETTDIKAETSAIKKDTSEIPSIKQDTAQIAGLIKEIGFLQLQVCDRRREDSNRGILLQRFLEESSSYAESAVDPAEFASTHADRGFFLEDVDQDQYPSSLIPPSTAASPSLAPELFSQGPDVGDIRRLSPDFHQTGGFDATPLRTNSTIMTDTTGGNYRHNETDPSATGLSPPPSTTLSSKTRPPVPKRKPLWFDQKVLPEHRSEHNQEVAGDYSAALNPLHMQLSFLSAVEHMKFLNLFISAAGGTSSETLSENIAGPILDRSKLPQSTLSRIWILSDTRSSGQLTFPEFALAMFLCLQSLRGKELPAVLSSQMQTEISNIIDRIFQSRPNASLSEQIAPTHGYSPALASERHPVSFGSTSNPFTSLLSAGLELQSDYNLSNRIDPNEDSSLASPQLPNMIFSGDSTRTQSRKEESTLSKEKAPRPKPNPFKTRIWTDRTGSFKVEAQFLGVADGKIYLHKMNSVKIAIPEFKMSYDDLAYVEQISGTRTQSGG